MSNSKAKTLNVFTNKNIPLQLALNQAVHAVTKGSSDQSALLYGTHRTCFAKLDDKGHLVDEKAQEIDLTTIYEARVFSEERELRWLHRDAGRGEAALLTEADLAGWETQKVLTAVDSIDQFYLLWGESLKSSLSGWTKMASARIGAYLVPVISAGQEKRRIHLKTCEYLCQDETNGNVFVAEERWLGLSVVPSGPEAKEK